MRIAVPTKGKRKLSNKIADTFSRAPNFTFVTVEDSRILSVDLKPNPSNKLERGAGPLAARFLKENDIDLLLTSDMGPGARNILDAFNIKVQLVDKGKTVKELITPYVDSF